MKVKEYELNLDLIIKLVNQRIFLEKFHEKPDPKIMSKAFWKLNNRRFIMKSYFEVDAFWIRYTFEILRTFHNLP